MEIKDSAQIRIKQKIVIRKNWSIISNINDFIIFLNQSLPLFDKVCFVSNKYNNNITAPLAAHLFYPL